MLRTCGRAWVALSLLGLALWGAACSRGDADRVGAVLMRWLAGLTDPAWGCMADSLERLSTAVLAVRADPAGLDRAAGGIEVAACPDDYRQEWSRMRTALDARQRGERQAREHGSGLEGLANIVGGNLGAIKAQGELTDSLDRLSALFRAHRHRFFPRLAEDSVSPAVRAVGR
jgi:hypothetical protein